MIVSATAPKINIAVKSQEWFVYILECSDSSFYTGITNNLEKRVKAHNEGKGAKCTRARLPVILRYYEKVENKGTALKREIEVKKLSHIQKLALIKKTPIQQAP